MIYFFILVVKLTKDFLIVVSDYLIQYNYIAFMILIFNRALFTKLIRSQAYMKMLFIRLISNSH